MVLQRDRPNTIWGWTRPKTEVRLEVGGNANRTVSGDDGRWSIRFTPPPAGGPYTVVLDGPEHTSRSNSDRFDRTFNFGLLRR